jgi:DNA-binding response OmpR family regulator
MTAARRILLVDDEPDLLHALQVRLRAAGYDCDTATNGKEALEKLAAARPDLLVLDLLMPEMNGYEVCHRLRQDPRLAGLPVLVLTAVPSHTVQRSRERLAGARVLHKPFDTDTLLAAVQEQLQPHPSKGARHG